MVQDQPHCPIPDLRGVFHRCSHSLLPPEDSTIVVSGIPGTVHLLEQVGLSRVLAGPFVEACDLAGRLPVRFELLHALPGRHGVDEGGAVSDPPWRHGEAVGVSCCPRRRGQPAAGLHAGGGAGTDPHADPLRRARPVRGRRARLPSGCSLPARPAFELGLEGERRESCTDRTGHGLMLRGRSQTFKDRPPGPLDQGDSLVTGAAQSGGRSAVGRRILARPRLSISIRYRLGVWDMNVGKDLLHQLKQYVI